jgi:hypothetical protein
VNTVVLTATVPSSVVDIQQFTIGDSNNNNMNPTLATDLEGRNTNWLTNW